MNIFTKAMNAIGIKGIKQPFTNTAASRWSLQFGGRYGGFLKKQNYIEEYKNWVYACVNTRAESVAVIDLVLKNKKGEVVDNHPMLDLLHQVNKGMTMYDLFFATQAFKDLDGNAYWFLARDNDGKGDIKEIHLLNPEKIQIVQSKENPMIVLGYVFIQSDGSKIPFQPDEILHFKNFNPMGYHPFPHKGMSIVEGAQWAVDTDNEIRTWNYNFFKNGARPDGILTNTGDGTMDEDSYKRLKEQWSAEHKGSENAHKTALLSGGMTWTKVSENQSELEFAGQKDMNRDEIASMFKVPKFILGVDNGTINKATADAAIYVYTVFTVKPLMQQLVNTLNEFYVPQFDDTMVFSFKSPVQDDRTAVVAEYTAGIDKWLSRNEIRAKEGLPPTRDGDQFQTPFNVVLADQVEKPKEVKAIEKPKAKKKAETAGEKAVEAFIAKLPPAKKKGLSAEAKEVWKTGWKALVESNTVPLKKELVKYFNKQEKEVMKNIKAQFKGLATTEYKTKAQMDLFNKDNAVSTGIDLITPNIQAYLDAGGANGASLTGVAFDNATQRVADFITSRAQLFAKTITDTTISALQDQITAGTAAGETIDQIAARVAQVYDGATGYRSEMIARTEVSAAQNFGSIEAYSQAGVELLEWTVVSPDDEDCLGNEGVEVKIGDAFPSGDTQPPVHPNCVCGTLPVFKNE